MRIAHRSRRPQKDASSSQARPATSEPTAEELREPQKRITVGLNFASSATSAACSGAGNPEPQSVTFGVVPGGLGGLAMAAYKLPSNVEFLGPGRFRTLGHETVTNMNTTSSGAKQSMDENLCTPGSEGAFFLELCEKYGVCKWDVIRQLLADAIPYIQHDVKSALGKDDRDTLEQNDWIVTNAVPMIWTGGAAGLEIQRRFTRCMEEVGYPVGNKIICEDESILTKTWVERREIKLSNRAVDPEAKQGYADVGACTTDLAVRLVWCPNTLLAEEAVGCAGGMADFWRWLHGRCGHSIWMFKAAQIFVHYLTPDTTEDFKYESRTITLDEMRTKLGKVFEAPLALIETTIEKHRRLTEFTVSGEAPPSNAFIKDMFETRIKKALAETGIPKCPVIFIKPEDASLAVSKGAAVPYDEDPRLPFWEGCFGIRLHACSEKKGCAIKGPCKGEKNYVAQLKARKKWKLADWVSLAPNESNGVLNIEPSMVLRGAPLKSKFATGTALKAWSPEYSVGMNMIQIECADAKRGTFVRFRWDGSQVPSLEGEYSLHQPLRLLLEVGEAKDGGGEIVVLASKTQTLILRLERGRLLFEPEGQEEEKEVGSAEQSEEAVEDSTNGSQHGPSRTNVEIPETPTPTPTPELLPITAPPLTPPQHEVASRATTAEQSPATATNPSSATRPRRKLPQSGGTQKNSPNKRQRRGSVVLGSPRVTPAVSATEDTQQEAQPRGASGQALAGESAESGSGDNRFWSMLRLSRMNANNDAGAVSGDDTS